MTHDGDGDLALADGTVLTAPSLSTLHGPYADSWRITQASSLFTYPSGESTTTYTDRSFPQNVVTLGDFSPAQIDAANASCISSGVASGAMMDACVLDLLVTSDWTFAAAAAATRSVVDYAAATFDAALKLFADPFYRNGPNDQGIGWNVLSSLQRVGIGFGFAALVGIPLGFILGRSPFLSAMINPIISLLRPVSPLAWLPIGLLVFKKADPAATYTIFICSIWPMIMNTAQGVQRVPQDYLNVARVLALSEWKVVTKILFPAVLPYMLTGIRLSIGTAWLVIVAAEMLTGGAHGRTLGSAAHTRAMGGRHTRTLTGDDA